MFCMERWDRERPWWSIEWRMREWPWKEAWWWLGFLRKQELRDWPWLQLKLRDKVPPVIIQSSWDENYGWKCVVSGPCMGRDGIRLCFEACNFAIWTTDCSHIAIRPRLKYPCKFFIMTVVWKTATTGAWRLQNEPVIMHTSGYKNKRLTKIQLFLSQWIFLKAFLAERCDYFGWWRTS